MCAPLFLLPFTLGEVTQDRLLGTCCFFEEVVCLEKKNFGHTFMSKKIDASGLLRSREKALKTLAGASQVGVVIYTLENPLEASTETAFLP